MSINVGTAVGYLDLDTSKFKNGLKTAQDQLKGFTDSTNSAGTKFQALGSSLKSVGSAITMGVSLPLLAVGAGAIKTASDFEAGMSKVSALSGATGDDLKMLEAKAKEMGASTKFSATESADALSYMALAGWDAEQMAAGLEPSLKLAGAAGMDLALTTDIVTDTMSMFGMEANEATKMTDMLAYAQANSNTDVQQLGEALKYCGASANAMGYDLADTTALLGTFADQGLKGSSAGTTLNAMFRDMKKNAEDGAIAIGKKNVSIVDANGNYRDMTDILADVEKATEGMTQAERDMALSSIWGTEALKGVNMAFEAGVPKIREFEEGIRKSDGAASDMYDTMQNNLKGSIDNMKSAFEAVLITIGEKLIPIFRNLVDGITNLLTWFNNLNPAIQNVIIGVGGFLAVLGPAILILGNLVLAFGKAITGIGLLKTALITLGTTMKTNLIAHLISFNMYLSTTIIPALTSFATMLSGVVTTAIGAVSTFLTGTLIPALTATAFTIGAVTIPIWAVIAAIGALIAIGVLLYKNWDEIKAKCIEIWQNNIKPIIETVTNTIKAFLTATWTGIQAFLTTCWNLLKQLATTTWNGIKTTIETVCNTIKTVVTTVWNAVKSTTSTVWNSIKSLIETTINGIKSVITNVFNSINSFVTTVWNNVKTGTSSAWDGIKSAVSNGVNAVKNVITSVWSGLQALLVAPFKAAQSVISGILSGISSAISSVTSAISSVKNAASNVIDKVNPFKKSIEVSYEEEPSQDNYRFRSEYLDLAKTLVYSDRAAKTSVAESISSVTKSALNMSKGENISNIKPNSSVVINNTYNSPKPASIRELKRQDEIQMRRLAMQLSF